MTDANATLANEDLRPIQDWENRDVKGHAMANKRVYESRIAEVTELRERQQAYEASLPKEPQEALSEITKTLVETCDINGPDFAARAALTIIYELSRRGVLDDGKELNEAVFWLSGQGLEGLSSIEARVRKVKDIAHQFHPTHEAYEA